MKQLLLIIILFMPCGLYAHVSTGALLVNVVDENGDDFLGANVMIYQGSNFIKGNSSDPFGNCTIENLEPGKYILKISFVGYEAYEAKITIESSQIITEKINMKVEKLTCTYVVGGIPTIPMIKDPFGCSETFETDQILKMPLR